ncbi:hypothetical protein QYF61_007744, partial [Mycteria americana]
MVGLDDLKAWGPSHGRQSSTNCSSAGPFHGVQSFRNRLLQCGSPTGSQVLPANLLQHGLLCMRLQVLPGAYASTGFQGITASFKRTHLLWRGDLHRLQVDICSTVDLHGLQGDSLPHHGLHHGLQGNLCSSAWNTSSPSFFTDP